MIEDIEGLEGANFLDAHGISLDGGMGVFASPSGVWLSMTSLAQFSDLKGKVDTLKAVDTKNPALLLVLDRGRALDALCAVFRRNSIGHAPPADANKRR